MNPPTAKDIYARRVDKNQPEIVKALRKAGYRVWHTHRAGFGFPDILVLSKAHIPVLIEIKMPGEKLTPAENKFHAEYRGPIAIVDNADEAIEVMQKYDRLEIVTETKLYWKSECGIAIDSRD
jgi:hypothetical protein